MQQIGTDQGLLPAPIMTKYLLLAPGERADLVIDFSQSRGAKIQLESQPFTLMEFRVGSSPVTDTSALPSALRPVPRIAESAAVQTRRLTLDENLSLVGRVHGNAAEQDAVARAHYGETGAEHDRNLGVGKSHRRHAPDSSAHGALSGSSIAAASTPSITPTTTSCATPAPSCRPKKTRWDGRTPCA